MRGIDFLIVGIILLIVGSVIWYIRSAKKKGVKCIGCPDSGSCSGNCNGCQQGNCKDF